MKKIIIFGNSGSGKSTLAKQLSETKGLAHLDLDTLAWLPTAPPERQSVDASAVAIKRFMNENPGWVIEGCYADLIELVEADANELIFLNLPVESCVENAKQRPWEPHKYSTREQQDSKLNMLIEWISEYPNRTDTFTQAAHQQNFDRFSGKKTMLVENEN